MSGPYALEAFGDTIFFGGVDIGSTEFAPLLVGELSARLRQRRQHREPRVLVDLCTGSKRCCRATRRSIRSSRRDCCRRPRCSTAPLPMVSIAGEATLSAELTALLGVPPTPGLPLSPQTPIFQLGFGNPYLINNAYPGELCGGCRDQSRRRRSPTAKPGVPLAGGQADARTAAGLLHERHAQRLVPQGARHCSAAAIRTPRCSSA